MITLSMAVIDLTLDRDFKVAIVFDIAYLRYDTR